MLTWQYVRFRESVSPCAFIFECCCFLLNSRIDLLSIALFVHSFIRSFNAFSPESSGGCLLTSNSNVKALRLTKNAVLFASPKYTEYIFKYFAYTSRLGRGERGYIHLHTLVQFTLPPSLWLLKGWLLCIKEDERQLVAKWSQLAGSTSDDGGLVNARHNFRAGNSWEIQTLESWVLNSIILKRLCSQDICWCRYSFTFVPFFFFTDKNGPNLLTLHL